MTKVIVAGLLFSLLGSANFLARYRSFTRNRADAAAAIRWPEASALVDRTYITSNRHAAYPRIAYRFELGGRTFHGNRLAFGRVITRSASQAAAMLAPYPQGSWIRIRFNPADPRENVVEPRVGETGSWVVLSASAVVAVIGLLLLVGAATGVVTRM